MQKIGQKTTLFAQKCTLPSNHGCLLQRQYRYAHKKLEVKSKTCPGCTGVALQTSSIVAGYLYGADTAARVSHPRVVRVLVSCSFSCFGCCLLGWLLAVSWFRALGRKNRKKGQKSTQKHDQNHEKTPKNPKNPKKPPPTTKIHEKIDQKPSHTTKYTRKSTKIHPRGQKWVESPKRTLRPPKNPSNPPKNPHTPRRRGVPPLL